MQEQINNIKDYLNLNYYYKIESMVDQKESIKDKLVEIKDKILSNIYNASDINVILIFDNKITNFPYDDIKENLNIAEEKLLIESKKIANTFITNNMSDNIIRSGFYGSKDGMVILLKKENNFERLLS